MKDDKRLVFQAIVAILQLIAIAIYALGIVGLIYAIWHFIIKYW